MFHEKGHGQKGAGIFFLKFKGVMEMLSLMLLVMLASYASSAMLFIFIGNIWGNRKIMVIQRFKMRKMMFLTYFPEDSEH